MTVDKADHETQGLPCYGSNDYKEFASGSSAPQRKTPDREENVLPLIQIKAIRRAPLVEFQTDIQSEGHVNIFNFAKNAGTSVDHIDAFLWQQADAGSEYGDRGNETQRAVILQVFELTSVFSSG